MPEPVALRTALDKTYRPLSGQFLTTVLVELAPRRDLVRLPLNLGLLLDTSESMAGDKLEAVRSATTAIIVALDAQDLVTVAAFNSRVNLLLRGERRGPAILEAAAQGLGKLRAEGVTSLLVGLDAVYRELRRLAGPDRTTYVMLLSDGYPTTPQGYIDDDREQYLNRVDLEMRERGVSLTTIGLGDAANYDQAFLRALADAGNGQCLYCRTVPELAERFATEFERIQRSVLSDVRLTVRDLSGSVRRLWRVYPDKKLFDPPKPVDGRFSVPVGALQEGQPQAFLLDVVTDLPPGSSPGRIQLLSVEVQWPSGGELRQLSAPVLLDLTDDRRALAQRNPEVVRLATECLDAMLEGQLEQAVASGDSGRQTNVLMRKKQLTRRLGKTDATRVLEEMEEALARGEVISQDALARSSQATKPTQRLG